MPKPNKHFWVSLSFFSPTQRNKAANNLCFSPYPNSTAFSASPPFLCLATSDRPPQPRCLHRTTSSPSLNHLVGGGVEDLSAAGGDHQEERLHCQALQGCGGGSAGGDPCGKHKPRLHIAQLVKDTSAKLKQASKTDQHAEVSRIIPCQTLLREASVRASFVHEDDVKLLVPLIFPASTQQSIQQGIFFW